MKSIYDVLLRPVITEKSSKLVEENKYTFEVHPSCNRTEVKQAVEQIWSVKVEKVNIVNCPKQKRRVGKYEGFKPQVKKAIVTVAKGQSIPAFEI